MEDCLFCKICDGSIPSKKVYEDDEILVFWDINPKAPVHVLIIPKKHIDSANDLTREDDALLGRMFEVARNVAKDLGISESGYRIVTNVGKDSGQMVKHIHLHLLGGAPLGA